MHASVLISPENYALHVMMTFFITYVVSLTDLLKTATIFRILLPDGPEEARFSLDGPVM